MFRSVGLISSAVLLICAAASGCSNGKSVNVGEVQASLDKTEVSLADSIRRAEAHQSKSVGMRAELIFGSEPYFSVHANLESSKKDVRVTRRGEVLTSADLGGAGPACSGPTSLADAVQIAEGAAGGKAFKIQPDDDDACLYEVQTLSGSTVWEVKIDRSGTVLEKEDATNDTEE